MAQVSATYTLAVDLQNNLGYADSGDDISAYWKQITVDYGMANPGEHFGRSAQMTVVLNNASHKFSPQHASALTGFTIGRKIRLQMTYSATTVTLYEGRIDGIAPTPGATTGTRETVVTCNGYLQRLQNDEMGIAIQDSADSGQIVTAILAGVHEYPAMLTGWFIGDSTWSVIGVTTRASAGPSAFANIETGANTYAFAGDNFQPKASPYGALRDVAESERGWIYEGRDGKLNFWNRWHLAKDLPNAVDATLTDTDVTPLRYAYGSTMLTTMDVGYHPRAIDGIGVELGASDKPVIVTKNHPQTITIRFVNDAGVRVGGRNIILPVAGVDYTGVKASATGAAMSQDLTKYLSVSMKVFGDRVEVTLSSRFRTFVARLRIRGTRITDFGAQKINYDDPAARALYGRWYKSLDMRLLEDSELANNIARWETASHNAPTGNMVEVGFYANKSNALMVDARDLDVGSRIALTETQTGVNNEYFIIGKHVELTPQNIHYERWILEPKPVQAYWIIGQSGFSNVGVSTTIGA